MPSHRFGPDYYQKVYIDYRKRNPDRKINFYHDLLRTETGDLTGKQVLDAGCALGAFLSQTQGAECYGIDVSEFAVRQLHTTLARAHLAVADLSAVPFVHRFDAVVAFDVLEHIADLEATARSIQHTLAPDGVFIFVVPVYDGPLGPLVRALDKDSTHVHREGRRFWTEWCSRHFQIVRWGGIFRYFLLNRHYLHWPSSLFRNASPAIYVVARPYRERKN